MAGREERTLRDPPLKRVTGETGIRVGCKAVWPGVSRGFTKGGQVKNYRICEHKKKKSSLVAFESVLNCKNTFFILTFA